MKDINQVMLLGNLGAEPEVKEFPDGNKLVRLSIATNRNWKDKNGEWQTDTEWHRVIVRGAGAQRAADLRKGARVTAFGSVQTRSYETEQRGKQYVTEIIVAGAGSFVADQTPRRQALEQEAPHAPAAPQAQAGPAATSQPAASTPEFDDDIPF